MRTSIGINTHLPGPPALDLAQQLGMGSVRCDFNWYDCQTGPETWDWTLFDQVVYGARQRNLEVLGTIGYTPTFLSGGHGRTWPPPVHDWEVFVRAIASRYRHNVWHWEVWNEPGQLYAGPVEQYVQQLLIPATRILHAIGPENRVVAPALSTEGAWEPWLKTCLTLARDHIDIISVHSYQDDGRAVWRALGDAKRWWEVWRGPSVRQVIQAAGCGDKPCWVSETGWESDDIGTEADQARAIDQLLEGLQGNPWVEKVFYYQLIDEANEQRGVYRINATRKPGGDVIQRYTQMPVA